DESWIPLLHPDDVKTCLDTWYDSVKTGKPYQIEYRFKYRENGGYRWFLGKALPVRNEDGIITKWFGTGTDIHDQKAIEEKLETLVNIRTTELKRSNEDLQQFAHVASHDLKEPVRKLKTFSSRLNDEFGAALPEKAKMYIDKMEKAANRMYAMIDGVLLYSSINVVDQIMDVVDLNKLLRQVEDDLEVVIHQKKAIIIYRNLPSIEGSEILLYQLFYNLVNNALKFSKEGFAPVVSIDCKTIYKQKEQHAEITVQDNGIGFDQAFAERIFKTFTRLNSKDLYEGTGLGLSLCKKIVERHGGAINARGKENEGAVFTIMLPVKQTSISIEI
ncbi:MAG TPA: ATP-binding protein, partial [Flavisolibacter sp.]|nr:ATP-binding protein [Flavisolibacter sp.]